MDAPLHIAIVSVNRDKYSETFIHNHVRRLPANILYLTGGYLPEQFSEGWEGEVLPVMHPPKPSFWKRITSQSAHTPSLETALVALLQKHKIDVVLAEYGPSGVEMMPVCKTAGIPLVVHFHGYDAYRDDIQRSYGPRYPELFREARLLIAVSRHMQQHLQHLGAASAKIRLNYYGADPAWFTASPAEKKSLRFLAAGRFCETKSPHLTLLAFQKLLAVYPQARLVMVGEGHLLPACRILAAALKIENEVSFTGALPHAEVAKHMQQAFAFVQHSLTTPDHDTEGTPVAIIEAAMSGLPVISTRHAGIPDVVEENVSGILVNEGDVQAMAEAMIQLASDPAGAERMGAKGREIALRRFSMDTHIQGLYRILKEALKL